MFEKDTYRDTEVNKFIIMLTDGEGDYDHALTQRAIDHDITLFTIGLGNSVNTSLLTQIATATGGNYYHAEFASDLYEQFEGLSEDIDLTKDSDGDGLCDYFEQHIRLGNGIMITTDKNNPDTDSDGLLDSEEVEFVYAQNGQPYFKLKSDPRTKYSDKDAYDDYTEVKADFTDPMVKNVTFADYHVDYIADNPYFMSTQYKREMNSDWGKQAAVWISNNIYGSNYDKKLIYKKALIDYFEEINQSALEQEEITSAISMTYDYIQIVQGTLDAFVIDSENIEECMDLANNIKQQITTMNENIEDAYSLVNSGAISAEEFYKSFDEFSNNIDKITKKSDGLNNVYNKHVSKPFSKKLVNGYKKFSKTASITFKVLEVGGAIIDTVKDYSKINANNTVIANNIYILEVIQNSSNEEELRIAAKELQEAVEGNLEVALTDAALNVGKVGLTYAKDKLLSAIPSYGIWIVIGLSLSDMLFNVSETAKRSVMTCGAGEAIDLLALDFKTDVSNKKQKNAYGLNTYVLYDSNAELAVRKFTNLSNMIIFGEDQMLLLHTENHQWIYDFSDWLYGGDTKGVINACNNVITSVKGFRYQYIARA